MTLKANKFVLLLFIGLRIHWLNPLQMDKTSPNGSGHSMKPNLFTNFKFWKFNLWCNRHGVLLAHHIVCCNLLHSCIGTCAALSYPICLWIQPIYTTVHIALGDGVVASTKEKGKSNKFWRIGLMDGCICMCMWLQDLSLALLPSHAYSANSNLPLLSFRTWWDIDLWRYPLGPTRYINLFEPFHFFTAFDQLVVPLQEYNQGSGRKENKRTKRLGLTQVQKGSYVTSLHSW